MNVGIVGAGYVGLVAGACFAESGNDVICADSDRDKVRMLREGSVPIYEPGLSEMVRQNSAAGRLSFTTDIETCVKGSEIIFVAVGTPQDRDGSADLRYVLDVAADIGRYMNGPKVIVNKSTVPVGTASLVSEEIRKHTSLDFHVVSNPEFLKEGSAIDDFMKPDRVVIGTDSVEAEEMLRELYAPFLRTGKPFFVFDVPSAEITKYASNALLAAKISFMNEIANLCEAVGADVSNVRRGVGSDSRIGPAFLFPGVGYGGSCFPKDVRALIRTASDNDCELEIVGAVDRVNTRQKAVLAKKIVEHFGGASGVEGKRLALWGLAFKPKTDDMREAPSVSIIATLCEQGASITAYDPEAAGTARRMFSDRNYDLAFADSSYDALKGADALIIVTEWNEFRRPNFARMQNEMKSPVVFDGRNLFDPAKMRRLGFSYYSVGRPNCLRHIAADAAANEKSWRQEANG